MVTHDALEEELSQRLKRNYGELIETVQLPTEDELEKWYTTFRERFGPEKLSQLDGEELLNTMHAHGSRDSLVYWLEFKNDAEFPDLFGSIAGGSALKFGIFKRQEDGRWVTGRSAAQETVSVENAIEIARSHREELVAASAVLANFSGAARDEEYSALQDRISAVAPNVSNTAWGHKYLSLLYPSKLDDYHVEEFQRFYLRKMLQIPPAKSGRYAAAGRYVAAAAALHAPMNHLTATLKSVFGRPSKVWRIGTRLGGKDSIWPMMRQEGCIAIGWTSVGDLSGVTANAEGKEAIRQKLESAGHASRNANQIFQFFARIEEGDEVLAADGEQILGIGRVTGPYVYDAVRSANAPHSRAVEWLDVEPWKLPNTEGLRSTVRQLKKFPENLVAVERRLLQAEMRPGARVDIVPRKTLESLPAIPARLDRILDRKGQAILYGPPGTGKTYWAEWTALRLAARSAFGREYEELESARQAEITGPEGWVRRCTFHPGYGYEDFIEGFRPSSGAAGGLAFELRDGIFKRLCKTAERNPSRRYYLLIDEINRGDIPRIFGELITLLEHDKRGRNVELPLSRQPFAVPGNVFVIGTMNTADRSIALLDAALRRRFGFVELMPDPAALRSATIANSIPLGRWLAGLNDRIRQHVRRDARNLQVGHAYLMNGGHPVTDFTQFSHILADDVIPLVEEYCYEDFQALSEVLGGGLVDENAQRIRTELFVPERRDDLIKALLEPWPEIATSRQAVDAAREDAELESAESEDAEDEAS